MDTWIYILLNETKLDSKICKDLLKIENYKIERCDRNREGGGIALYIKDSIIPCTQRFAREIAWIIVHWGRAFKSQTIFRYFMVPTP